MASNSKDNRGKKNFGGNSAENQQPPKGNKKGNTGDSKQTDKRPDQDK